MKDYIKHQEWKIVEEGFNPEYNRISESIFSIGNGYSGQRANFEETYSGDSLQGNYIAGVYYPDKTLVGWWKNGYPEYFAKVPNAANWVGISIRIGDDELDLARCKIQGFRRELDMKRALLTRTFHAWLPSGKEVRVVSERFLSIREKEMGMIRYKMKSLNFWSPVRICSFIDGDIRNEDSNYDEKFWTGIDRHSGGREAFLLMETKKTGFQVCHGMVNRILINGEQVPVKQETVEEDKYVAQVFNLRLNEGDELVIEKFVAIHSSLYADPSVLEERAGLSLQKALKAGFDRMRREHIRGWADRWETSDIRIEGDTAAQQGIRFNIFQLMQTYTGEDERLNIGPKGFTGEKYGGVTYWDTEAYCLPFFLGTAPQHVARNLLLYRHKHLQKAIENAEKLGFTNGAALYPMVTVNGEECHNEWEITFEEIHRNGAIAYAIWNYINYTGDREYLAPYGFEVLLALSRFWSRRVNWSEAKKAWVILGVTGPNEYENNVNNNFHTNRMAAWTLQYTLEAIGYLKKEHAYLFEELVQKWKFNELEETARWKDIVGRMYFPFDAASGLYLQQDGFLDKEIIPAEQINPDERPVNQHWSWDRILRSCYIKQADLLQNMYWFYDDFGTGLVKKHFDFYEPITVHESSLSPCIHAILAARTGLRDKAYEMYLRTARLDLDDYNNDTRDGLHITSMGGTWMAFVEAFGGMRVMNGKLHLNPFLPESWKAYSFRINFHDSHLEIQMNQVLKIINHNPGSVDVVIWGKEYRLEEKQELVISCEP